MPGLELDPQARIDKKQNEAAKAPTVGEFRSRFQASTNKLMHEQEDVDGDGASLENYSSVGRQQLHELIQERRTAIDTVTEGIEDMSLEDMEVDVLGYNHIGAGRSGANLNSKMFSDITNGSEKEQAQHAAAHETAHGNQVALHGMLTDMRGRLIDPLLLYEGHAEVTANEKVGIGRRAGQPGAIYGEGQDLVSQIISSVGRGVLEETLTGDGDVTRLQKSFRSNYFSTSEDARSPEFVTSA